MLTDELSGRPYNKAVENRALQVATGRSRGSIEFKLCNLSAAALSLGLPVIRGYRPRFNFQMSLPEAILRWLARHPDWEAALHRRQDRQMADPAPLFVGTAPTLRNAPPPAEAEQMERVARTGAAARNAGRSRAMADAGQRGGNGGKAGCSRPGPAAPCRQPRADGKCPGIPVKNRRHRHPGTRKAPDAASVRSLFVQPRKS
ncbi:hypothetical protein [Mangrovicoccus ximenensis]|uniref:hypothetical protein n=1 Tax=Mangrovicoccus ximenensis TaxID=1911570 RepID=UPI00191BDDF1|nr:hypothetical protein [Mangrovicoccus ximenensis]